MSTSLDADIGLRLEATRVLTDTGLRLEATGISTYAYIFGPYLSHITRDTLVVVKNLIKNFFLNIKKM